MSNTIMPHWSKYAGRALDEVPESYLQWIYFQDWLEDKDPDLYIEIEDYLEEHN